MNPFKNFQVLEMRNSNPNEWLCRWDKYYMDQPRNAKFESEYSHLIKKYKSLLAEDFIRIAKWKDGVTTENQWKPDVASAAYKIWKKAAEELPKCPKEKAFEVFLGGWSNASYTDKFKNVSQQKHFGLSRATTLLHFLSGGRYPIFDSRVKTAIARLLGTTKLPNTVDSYNSYRSLFKKLAAHCKTEDNYRRLDRALFSYGALDKRVF